MYLRPDTVTGVLQVGINVCVIVLAHAQLYQPEIHSAHTSPRCQLWFRCRSPLEARRCLLPRHMRIQVEEEFILEHIWHVMVVPQLEEKN